ncbi:hypothetical protein KDL01_27960, partial [Actinospica durhamensis]|nr:hypothetical protein [Actinospica durhamensis]
MRRLPPAGCEAVRERGSTKRKRAEPAVSPQSTPTTSESTPAPGGGETPPGELAQFGPNEWLVDEIYQQYLHDPESVDKAWWDFFNDYQPAATSATGSAPAPA